MNSTRYTSLLSALASLALVCLAWPIWPGPFSLAHLAWPVWPGPSGPAHSASGYLFSREWTSEGFFLRMSTAGAKLRVPAGCRCAAGGLVVYRKPKKT